MSAEQAPQERSPEWQPHRPAEGSLRNRFENQRRTGPGTELPNEARIIGGLRQELAEFEGSAPPIGLESSLHFPPHRLDSVLSYSNPAQRQKHFNDNTQALTSLAGDRSSDAENSDFSHVSKNPLIKIGDVLLDIVRFPVNPNENLQRANEGVKRFARKLPFTKNWGILKEKPIEAAHILSTHTHKAEYKISSSLTQMRRDALAYDGENPIMARLINHYAKGKMNMPVKKALFWFGVGNFPILGYIAPFYKLYLPNIVGQVYNKNTLRATKTIALTLADILAQVYQYFKGTTMVPGAVELFTTRGFLGGLTAIPGYIASNWEVLAPLAAIIAYNPFLMQGRLDENDYRRFATAFGDIGKLLWESPDGKKHVASGVAGMIADYGKSHPGNTPSQNENLLTEHIQSGYKVLRGRVAAETSESIVLHEQLQQMDPEKDAKKIKEIKEQIFQLILRNRADKARLLYLENLLILMQETGFLEANTQ